MIKKILTIFLVSAVLIFSQTEYVDIKNPVYSFLERMEIQHQISGYNEFEIPKTRNEIAEWLREVQNSGYKLNSSDNLQFQDLIIEFDIEYTNSTENTVSIINGDYDIFSNKSKYLFFDTGRSGNLFISLLAEPEIIYEKHINPGNISGKAFLMKFGGEIRGTIIDKFGFSIRGTNGKASGDKSTAYLKQELRYNLKFNENNENFFDETEGYFTADFDLVRFKIGRDRMNIGPGKLRPILGSYSPSFDYLLLNINYSILSFSFFHGKLLGNVIPQPDPVAGGSVKVTEKYLGYHRLGFDFSRHFNLGAGEMIVYGDRPIDLSYLNPFNFYKSAEHSNRDRDNSIMFFDITNNSIRHLKFFSLFLIDDLSFKKLNTGWWGNQFMVNAGATAVNIMQMPLDIRLEYLRIEPYTFTHRLSRNNYTNYNYKLGSFAEPNSELFLGLFNYRFTGRVSAELQFIYYVHGANPLNEDGTIRENVGGDILLGHRSFDSQNAPFLAGDHEFTRSSSIRLNYEPVNQFIFTIQFNYINESLQNRVSQEKIESFINLSVRI